MQRQLCTYALSCWLLLLTVTHVFKNNLAEITSNSAKGNVLEDSDPDFITVKKLEFHSTNRTEHKRKYKDLSSWSHPHFDYDANHGPKVWYRMYPPCMGGSQSPVDLDTSTAKSTHSPRMLWWGYALKPTTMTLTNNGHTVVLAARWNSTEDVPYVWDSPGDEEYKFAQLHFHWGNDDITGSEHTINKERFPLELHMVHYLHSLGSLENALHYETGVRVVGVLYRLSEESNPTLDHVISSLYRVVQAGSSVSLEPFPLTAMLRSFSRHFLAYNGSLTTPPCLEVVQWVLSTDPHEVSRQQHTGRAVSLANVHFKLSATQFKWQAGGISEEELLPGVSTALMAAFRSLLDHKGAPIVENFRPLQPLNTRLILHIR